MEAGLAIGRSLGGRDAPEMKSGGTYGSGRRSQCGQRARRAACSRAGRRRLDCPGFRHNLGARAAQEGKSMALVDMLGLVIPVSFFVFWGIEIAANRGRPF